MVFNIHISVKSRKSVFSAISNKLFMGLCIPLAVKSYWKFLGFKLLYLRGGKGGFPGFHGNVIHISVKSGKSVFSTISNKLFMGLCIPLAVKSYWKFLGFKLLYLRGGKGGFPGFHGNVNI